MARSDRLFTQLGLKPEQMFRQIQKEDNAGAWLYVCQTGEYWWSDQVYDIYGLSRDTPLSPDVFLNQVHEQDADLARETFLQAMQGRPYHFNHRIRLGAEVKWLEQRGRLYSGEQYPTAYLLGTVHDVTQLHIKQERLDVKRADYAAITQYLAETTDTTNLAAIVGSVKRTIRSRMDVAIIAVFVRQNELVSRVIPPQMDPLQAFVFQDIRDFVGYRTVMTGARQQVPVSEYPSALGREALEDLGAKTVVALPIKHSGNVIGALSIVTRREGGLDRREDEFCRTICGYLSTQLNNALLYDRLKQELELRVRLESDREVIFNESVDFISIMDSEGRFVQINPAFADRLGYSQEALIGRSVFDYIHPDDRAYAWQVFGSLPRTGVIRGFRNRFLCRGDEVGYLENNLKYMDRTGESIAIARDLTDQKQMEARNTLLEQSVAFERTKSEFFAGLSHEFKTPLNIILSSLDLIRLKSSKEDDERFQNQYAKFFDYAYQNCYKLLRLSSNLLDASRMESGFYKLHVTRVQVDALLRSIVDAAAVYAEARNVRLDFRSLAQPERWLACDEDAVERILLNLLSNAIKNSREQGVVHVTLEEQERFFLVRVDDNGGGIAPEALPQIFEKFLTSPNPVTGQREGSGIGLSLVKSLTELHGGVVQAQSQVGVGSRFSFTLLKNLEITDELERPTAGAVTKLARLELSDVKR